MRAQRLLSLDLPVLALTDQVARALQVMDELKLMHLAVVEEDVYKGTVSEEALLELDESALIAEAPMTSDAIAPDLHVYDMVARMGWADVDLLPVVEEGLYRGERRSSCRVAFSGQTRRLGVPRKHVGARGAAQRPEPGGAVPHCGGRWRPSHQLQCCPR